MKLNPWTIINTPRIQLTLLDELVLAGYAVAIVGVAFLLFCWWVGRAKP